MHQTSWKSKKLVSNGHCSVFQRHKSGKAFSAEVKQVYLNVYQTLRNEGNDMSQAISRTSVLCGVRPQSVEAFVKEKLWAATLHDNKRKMR